VNVEGRVFVLQTFSIKDGRVTIVAYEGDEGVSPLYYDSEKNAERIGKKRESELLATRTHAVIDIASRICLVEYNHRGAKASHIIRMITRIAQEVSKDPDLEMDMPPVPGDEFTKELQLLDRIVSAEIRAFEPNYSWDDQSIKGIAQDSNARSASLTLTAKRNNTLSWNNGLIAFLKELAKIPHPNVKEAIVKGIAKEGSKKTVKLKNHGTQCIFDASISRKDGYPSSDSIKGHLHENLTKILRRRNKE
jgi:hypothetical protein